MVEAGKNEEEEDEDADEMIGLIGGLRIVIRFVDAKVDGVVQKFAYSVVNLFFVTVEYGVLR